ncbi:methionine-R-sulfoxide reductase B1-like isoform X2 [Dermacentor albipictus]|uniref:methionine-R-sulfoxide reductase B1-like isoform X2 n=1 Tax=Dermacentor albipictus TaxID=60249 RepID=UPI0031FC5453
MAYCMWNGAEKYRNTFVSGTYVCSQCGYELFSSRTKFSHNSPWPAFTETIHEDSVTKRPEIGRPTALKVYCGKCKQGLGHEFLGDGPNVPGSSAMNAGGTPDSNLDQTPKRLGHLYRCNLS